MVCNSRSLPSLCRCPTFWSIRVAMARERELSVISHFSSLCRSLLFSPLRLRQRKELHRTHYSDWKYFHILHRFWVLPSRKPGKNLITQTLKWGKVSPRVQENIVLHACVVYVEFMASFNWKKWENMREKCPTTDDKSIESAKVEVHFVVGV